MPIRAGIEISEADAIRYDALKEKAAYYDRLQVIMKTRLNSLFGALANKWFRFFDPRLGESVTCTGRLIAKHQAAEANRLLTGDYQFDGEAIIYIDTDSAYFHTYADDTEEAVKVADAVAKYVNASLPGFMERTFLCGDGYKDIIQTKRDIVSDRGIFIDKKRYILHCVDVEGFPADKMKVMGVELKKTSLPKDIAVKLSAFIERLLKGETWDAITADVVDLKDYLFTTPDIMALGLPKGIKKELRGYTRAYRMEGDKAKLPGHIAAAIHYNDCLDKYADSVSPRIVAGDRLKLFYLDEAWGRFKSIALPMDIEEVPDWFTRYYTIDREKHMARLVDSPLNNILKAISKYVRTKQEILHDDLLGY